MSFANYFANIRALKSMHFFTICTPLAVATILFALVSQALADTANLPVRNSQIPKTTNGVPHVQIDVTPNPAISAELLVRASKIPGVEIRETVISLPGAKGFWINEGITISRPQVIVGGREFAHMHPDGSLHASLSPEMARNAVESGWATYHPWADQRPGWEGFVMIYTPTTRGELEMVVQLVLGSYNFVTGGS
ncbi:MAG: luciferase family protein [Rhizobiaceae bacterium]